MSLKHRFLLPMMGIIAYAGISTSQIQASAPAPRPLVEERKDISGASAHHSTHTSPSSPSLHGSAPAHTTAIIHKKIMIAEDEKVTKKINHKLVTAAVPSHEIIEADNGQDAYHIISQHPEQYALVITDHNMGGGEKDGAMLVTSLRANSATKHIPIIMISGGNSRDALGLPDDVPLVEKPINKVKLAKALSDVHFH
ncbi:MAG: hypothetical protein H0U27_07955 [Nitrosopumilus sp.]|nr:hypothetical protein [Nitrosopumilus sp.]